MSHRRTWLRYGLALAAVALPALSTASLTTGESWVQSDNEIYWYHNTSSLPTCSSSAIEQIKLGRSAWTTGTGADFKMTSKGNTSRTGDSTDGKKVWYGENLGWWADTVAFTSCVDSDEDGDLDDCDTLLNTGAWWNCTGGGMFTYDLRNVATHEWGHWGHIVDEHSSTYADATMYADMPYGETKKQTLTADDINAWCSLYSGC